MFDTRFGFGSEEIVQTALAPVPASDPSKMCLLRLWLRLTDADIAESGEFRRVWRVVAESGCDYGAGLEIIDLMWFRWERV